MICNTKTGCLVTGTLIKDAEYKTVGQHGTPLLKMCVRYGYASVDTESGKRKGKLIDVNLWGGDADKLKDVMTKGVPIMAVGELKSTQSNDDKTYYSINSYGNIFLSAATMLDYIDRHFEQTARITAGAPTQKPQSAVIDPISPEFAVIDDNEDLPF